MTVDNRGNIYFTLGKGGLWKINENEHNGKQQRLGKDREYMSKIVWNGNNIIYICEPERHRLVAYSIDTGNISAFAGFSQEWGHRDGNLEHATLYYPNSIAVGKNGDLYMGDRDRIRKVNIEKRTVQTIAGPTGKKGGKGYQDGEAKDAKFFHPAGITVSADGTIYVAEYKNKAIRKIKDGVVSTISYPQGGKPYGIIMDVDQTLFVASDNGLVSVNITNNSAYAVTNCSWDCLALDWQGNIFAFCDSKELWKLTNTWKKYERLLWIGYLKDEASYCPLATLPRDIIKEIVRCF